MRLWHKDLIPYLPKQQLTGQWRELCLIASLLANDHTPNHILVNPILEYPPEHFEIFCSMVYHQMVTKGFNISEEVLNNLETNLRAWRIYLDSEVPWNCLAKDFAVETDEEIFDCWHTGRYLNQCYYNLEEKYDRGGIPHDEWMMIFANFGG